MVDSVGITGLTVAVISESFKVINLITQWIQDSKAFGSDTRSIKTRLVAASARLKMLTSFLREETTTGARIEKMSEIQQTAILGMIRELDILFASYSEVIKKYGYNQLVTGLAIESVGQGISSFPDQTKSTAKDEAKHVQGDAGHKTTILWGLFRKKAVLRLIASLERWNDMLMQFLLCCLTFGGQAETSDKAVSCAGGSLPDVARDTPSIRIAVTLKQLLADQTLGDQDLFRPNWVLQPMKQSRDERLKTLIADGRKTTVFVEQKPVNIPRRALEALRNAKLRASALGKQLSLPDATASGFYTLRCTGIIPQDRPTGFNFVFELPNALSTTLTQSADQVADTTHQNQGDQAESQELLFPTSLSAAITSSNYVRPTLNERFRLAANLTRTCRQFHCVGWLHKSIRSQNVLLFPRSTIRSEIEPTNPVCLEYSRPYLAGFEFSRAERHYSEVESDDDLAKNLYRAPGRWGLPEARFSVLDDLYALGVILLEIGIWRPLIKFEDRFQDMTPEEVKACLIQHATQRLPHYMGVDYTQAVLSCLQGSFGSLEEQVPPADSGQAMSLPVSDDIGLNILVNDDVIMRIEAGAQLE